MGEGEGGMIWENGIETCTIIELYVQDSRYFLSFHVNTAMGKVDSFVCSGSKTKYIFKKFLFSPHLHGDLVAT